mgnify:CR=1 FL=1
MSSNQNNNKIGFNTYQDINKIYCDYYSVWYKIYNNAFHYDLYCNFYNNIHLELEELIKYSSFKSYEKWYNCIFNLFKQ